MSSLAFCPSVCADPLEVLPPTLRRSWRCPSCFPLSKHTRRRAISNPVPFQIVGRDYKYYLPGTYWLGMMELVPRFVADFPPYSSFVLWRLRRLRLHFYLSGNAVAYFIFPKRGSAGFASFRQAVAAIVALLKKRGKLQLGSFHRR